jgi:hypothetical protein
MIRVQAYPLNFHNEESAAGEQVLLFTDRSDHDPPFPVLPHPNSKEFQRERPLGPSNVPVQVTTAAAP